MTGICEITQEQAIENAAAGKYDSLLTLSGGIDSTVLAHDLVNDGVKPLCVYVKYGSNAEPGELRCANLTCKRLGLDLLILDIGETYRTLSRSKLIGNTEDFKPGSMFWLEGRNGLIGYMLSILASNLGLPDVYLGINASDSCGDYVDTTEQFITSLNLTIMNSFRNYVRVYAPWITHDMGKADIIELGNEYGVNWTEETHSCSSGAEHPCMDYEHCESCKFRRMDFEEAGLTDPFDKEAKS